MTELAIFHGDKTVTSNRESYKFNICLTKLDDQWPRVEEHKKTQGLLTSGNEREGFSTFGQYCYGQLLQFTVFQHQPVNTSADWGKDSGIAPSLSNEIAENTPCKENQLANTCQAAPSWRERIIFQPTFFSIFEVVVSTHLKNISQIGSSPQVRAKITNIWNHHLVFQARVLSVSGRISHHPFFFLRFEPHFLREWCVYKSGNI